MKKEEPKHTDSATGKPRRARRDKPILAESPTGTLTEQAHRRLEEMIVTLELAPGSVVSEATLSASLAIGMTPIREALQRLAREHLVRILPRRGVIVTPVDVMQQLKVLETRRELDRLMFSLAARRATIAEREQFTALAATMKRAVDKRDIQNFLRADNELNVRTAHAARNEIAASTVATLHSVSRRFWFFHHKDGPAASKTMLLHVTLVLAVASGKEDKAAAASDRLIDDLVEFARGTVVAK